jgi:hypothetical protein
MTLYPTLSDDVDPPAGDDTATPYLNEDGQRVNDTVVHDDIEERRKDDQDESLVVSDEDDSQDVEPKSTEVDPEEDATTSNERKPDSNLSRDEAEGKDDEEAAESENDLAEEEEPDEEELLASLLDEIQSLRISTLLQSGMMAGTVAVIARANRRRKTKNNETAIATK